MIPRNLLDTALIPDTDMQLQLYQSGELFSIKIPGRGDLMNSRVHGSEKALAELACENLRRKANPRLLQQAGFDVREHTVRPHRAGKGPRHHIWIGT